MERPTPEQEMEYLFQVPNVRGSGFPGPGISKRYNLTQFAQLFNGNPYIGGDVAILNTILKLLKQPDWGSFWLMRISDYLRQQNVVVGAAPEKDLCYYIEHRWTTYAASGPEKVLSEAAKQVKELTEVFFLPLTYMRTLADCVTGLGGAHKPLGFETGGPTPIPLGGDIRYSGTLPGGIALCSDNQQLRGRGYDYAWRYQATEGQNTIGDLAALEPTLNTETTAISGNSTGIKVTVETHLLGGALGDFTSKIRRLVSLVGNSDDVAEVVGEFNAKLDGIIAELEQNAAPQLATISQTPVEAAEPGAERDTNELALLHVTFGAEPFDDPCTEFTGIKGTFWITDADLFALMTEVSVWCDGRYEQLVTVVRDTINLGSHTKQDLLAKIIGRKSGVSYQGNSVTVNGIASVLSETTLSGLVEAAVAQYIRRLYEDHEITLSLAAGVMIDNHSNRKVVIAQRWLELLSSVKAIMGALSKTLEWSEETVKRALATYQREAHGLATKPLDIDMPVLFQVPQRSGIRYTSFPILVEDFRTLLDTIKIQSCPEYRSGPWYSVSMLEYLQWCAKTMPGTEYDDSIDLIKCVAVLFSNKKATKLEYGDRFELTGVGEFIYSPQLLSDMVWGWLLYCGAELVCNLGTIHPTSQFDAAKTDTMLHGASVRATVLWRLFSGKLDSLGNPGGKTNVHVNSTGSTITLKGNAPGPFVELPAVKWLLG